MFAKIEKTVFPPKNLPVMVWDGNCGFCNYWITNWKSKTGGRLQYKTYQETADDFKDIPLKEFKKASRLIEPSSIVYSGPASAYRSFYYFKKSTFPWYRWYCNYSLFTYFSDHSYNFIAKHRAAMFTLTKIFFGKDPDSLKPYWIVWMLLLGSVLFLLLNYL